MLPSVPKLLMSVVLSADPKSLEAATPDQKSRVLLSAAQDVCLSHGPVVLSCGAVPKRPGSQHACHLIRRLELLTAAAPAVWAEMRFGLVMDPES